MEGTENKNKEYLNRIFTMLKKLDGLTIMDRDVRFNRTELRLLTEVILAKCENRRIISMQLAKRLNITRSAVSQIVNRFETQGIIRRLPDAVDKKIAYIEFTGEAEEIYERQLMEATAFVGRLVERFGAEKLETMLDYAEEFGKIVNDLHEEDLNALINK